MATEGPQGIKPSGLTASADLSSHQFKFVKISGAGTVTVCSAVTDTPIGVLQNKPTSGQAAEIISCGVTKVLSSAAITAGALLSTDAAGLALTTTSAAAQTKFIVGQALSTSGAANGVVTAAINCLSQAHGGS